MGAAMTALNAIGSVLGIPAALLIGWLFLKTREHTAEITSLKKEVTDMKGKNAEEIEAIRQENSEAFGKLYEKMNLLANDVAFIRGRMEREK